MTIENAAQLMVATVEALAARAPAIVAAAAQELGAVQLGLHFGDRSHASLVRQHSRLVARLGRHKAPAVEVHFDDRALKLLFEDRKSTRLNSSH